MGAQIQMLDQGMDLRWPVTKYSVRVKIWSGRTKYASIFGPPPPQTVLLVAHAFRRVKARVTASETAREMCADENEDLVEKACYYLFDGRLRVVPATTKESLEERLQHLL